MTHTDPTPAGGDDLFTLTVHLRGNAVHQPATETFKHITRAEVERIKQVAVDMATDGGEGVAFSVVPETVTEYVIAEQVTEGARAGRWVALTHAGSWYTDRYYADDKRGADAAAAALVRLAAEVPGRYMVRAVRAFTRPESARMVVGECEGHESLDGAHMGETVYCDGTCR